VTERDYRKITSSWVMYDWANSGFYTSVLVVLFPYFHRAMIENAGLTKQDATAYLGYTLALSLLLSAVMAPVMGAIADHTGGRKRYFAFFLAIGVLATASLIVLGPTAYLLGSVLFGLAYVAFSGAEVFYESLLPHIATRNDIDQISARGYALGYLGGGILLAINALWLVKPNWFFMPDRDFAVRASFLSVAVWWAVFSLPLLRNVPEPPLAPSASERASPVRAGLERLGQTVRRLSRYRQLLLFLAAFWLYSDGIGTIIKMSFSYGEEMGIAEEDLVLAILITQFIAFPCAIGFGWMARQMGTKKALLVGLAVFIPICIIAYNMTAERAYLFYVLAFLVATVLGGTQALSRSLYGAMVPKSKSAEFFGFFSISSKFAGLFGPVLIAVLGQLKGTSRPGILFLAIFFIVGGLLLLLVNEQKGILAARQEDAQALAFPQEPVAS